MKLTLSKRIAVAELAKLETAAEKYAGIREIYGIIKIDDVDYSFEIPYDSVSIMKGRSEVLTSWDTFVSAFKKAGKASVSLGEVDESEAGVIIIMKNGKEYNFGYNKRDAAKLTELLNKLLK